jgi:hypothetical protein
VCVKLSVSSKASITGHHSGRWSPIRVHVFDSVRFGEWGRAIPGSSRWKEFILSVASLASSLRASIRRWTSEISSVEMTASPRSCLVLRRRSGGHHTPHGDSVCSGTRLGGKQRRGVLRPPRLDRCRWSSTPGNRVYADVIGLLAIFANHGATARLREPIGQGLFRS